MSGIIRRGNFPEIYQIVIGWESRKGIWYLQPYPDYRLRFRQRATQKIKAITEERTILSDNELKVAYWVGLSLDMKADEVVNAVPDGHFKMW